MIFKAEPPTREGGRFLLQICEPRDCTEWGFMLTADDMRNLQFVVMNARVQYRDKHLGADGGIREAAL